MTVCIAAISKDGESVVVGADRDLTLPGIILKVDQNKKKIDQLTEKSLVMGSGDEHLICEIVDKTKEKLNNSMTIRQISETLKETFMNNHIERVENVILKPYGYNSFKDFNSSAINQMPTVEYQKIHDMIFNFGLNIVEFLIVGCDSAGAHIFRVFYGGVNGGNWIEWCDKMGYRVIGSGCSYAYIFLSMQGQNSKLTLNETMANVYRAKKVAEMAPGVGREDDFAIVESSGIKFISKKEIEEIIITK